MRVLLIAVLVVVSYVTYEQALATVTYGITTQSTYINEVTQ